MKDASPGMEWSWWCASATPMMSLATSLNWQSLSFPSFPIPPSSGEWNCGTDVQLEPTKISCGDCWAEDWAVPRAWLMQILSKQFWEMSLASHPWPVGFVAALMWGLSEKFGTGQTITDGFHQWNLTLVETFRKNSMFASLLALLNFSFYVVLSLDVFMMATVHGCRKEDSCWTPLRITSSSFCSEKARFGQTEQTFCHSFLK